MFILYFVSLHLAYYIDGNVSYSSGHQISYNSYITLNYHSGYEKRREKIYHHSSDSSTVRSTIGRTDNYSRLQTIRLDNFL